MLMAQDIFMASMYFFVPINKVRLSKSYNFNPIECASLFQSVSSTCYYCEVSEKHQDFYFNSVIDSNNQRERQIQARVYIVRYMPSPKESEHFLVVGVGIDKFFKGDTNAINIDDYCDDVDLVILKQAFYSENNKAIERSGLYYPKNDPTIFHREWLCNLVHEFDKEPSPIIMFDASITDIRAVVLASVQGITDKANLQTVFDTCYLRTPCLPYNKVLDVDADRLAYGILVGNENYARLPDDLIETFKKDSYSNSMSERIFTASNSILFLRTHHPYLDIQKDVITHLDMKIEDLDARNIYELCHSLYLKNEFESIRNQVKKETRSGTIKKTADRLAYLQNAQLFNFHEADRRLETLFRGLGVTKETQDTDKLVNNYLSNKRFSYSRKQNRWIIGLTLATIIIGTLALAVGLWPCQIRDYLVEELQYGDITYPRWVSSLYILAYFVIIIPIFMFFLKLKIPFDRWLAIKIENFLNRVHKKAIGDK